MRIVGLRFAGTATTHRDEMRAFVSDVLGLSNTRIEGIDADIFELPDGSLFAVAAPGGMGDTHRSIGFLVEDLDAALDELRAAGIRTDPQPSENEAMRYAHFVAPDGCLYELVEDRS